MKFLCFFVSFVTLTGCASSYQVNGLQRQVIAHGDIIQKQNIAVLRANEKMSARLIEQDRNISITQSRVSELESRLDKMNLILDKKFKSSLTK